MEELKDLRKYLIKRFILTVTFISGTEYVVMLLLRRTLVPFVLNNTFSGLKHENINAYTVIVGTLLLFALLIINIIKYILPNGVFNVLDRLADYVSRSFEKLLSGQGKAIGINFGPMKGTILFITFIAIILMLLIPIILGAVYYSAVVVKKVRELEAKEQEEKKEYDRRRNLMLSDIAHDLRTPMTTVSGYARAISDGMVTPEKMPEYLSAIEVKSEKMNELINLLFDYVRLDSEGFKLNMEKVDICEAARESAAFLYQDIEDKGMELVVGIPDREVYIEADRIQISRVISNLITNAMKHNDAGTKIGVYVSAEEESDIKIMVADTGAVIPDDIKENIFEPFVMGDESRQSKGGSGLGLSIVKKVVEMHGFKLRLLQEDEVKRTGIKKEFKKVFVVTVPT